MRESEIVKETVEIHSLYKILNKERKPIHTTGKEGKEILSAHIRESYLSLSLLETKIEYYQLKQAVNNRELLDKKTQMEMGIISEADFIETMILSLGNLAEAYALLAEHQSKVLTVEMLLGKEAWNP
jgi:hypothetical protein